jgi:undecaprenyl pyrophosphate synthase
MDSIAQKQKWIACMFYENGGRGLVQLEAYAVEITKLVEYVDSKEDPLIHVVRLHQHNINSEVLQTAKSLKTEVQHIIENIRQMASEEDAWTIAM